MIVLNLVNGAIMLEVIDKDEEAIINGILKENAGFSQEDQMCTQKEKAAKVANDHPRYGYASSYLDPYMAYVENRTDAGPSIHPLKVGRIISNENIEDVIKVVNKGRTRIASEFGYRYERENYFLDISGLIATSIIELF